MTVKVKLMRYSTANILQAVTVITIGTVTIYEATYRLSTGFFTVDLAYLKDKDSGMDN